MLSLRVSSDVFTALIENTATWTMGTVFAWHLRMRCDDPKKQAWLRAIGMENNPSFGCPKGTAEADYAKCTIQDDSAFDLLTDKRLGKSSCWTPIKNADGTINSWKTRAAAYTENWRSVHVGMMNWCPAWFSLPTCTDAYAKWSRYSSNDKWDMTNYQCRGK